jgi:hypothetical protein
MLSPFLHFYLFSSLKSKAFLETNKYFLEVNKKIFWQTNSVKKIPRLFKIGGIFKKAVARSTDDYARRAFSENASILKFVTNCHQVWQIFFV